MFFFIRYCQCAEAHTVAVKHYVHRHRMQVVIVVCITIAVDRIRFVL